MATTTTTTTPVTKEEARRELERRAVPKERRPRPPLTPGAQAAFGLSGRALRELAGESPRESPRTKKSEKSREPRNPLGLSELQLKVRSHIRTQCGYGTPIFEYEKYSKMMSTAGLPFQTRDERGRRVYTPAEPERTLQYARMIP
jgi:hypothetical protein